MKKSVKALELQSRELKSSVEQQQKMVEVASAQHSLEKEAMSQERKQQALATSPVWKIVNAGMQGGNPPQRFIQIRNFGAEIHNLIVTAKNTEGRFLLNQEYPVFGRNDACRFSVDEPRSNAGGVELRATYVTQDGSSKDMVSDLYWATDSNTFDITDFHPTA